MDTRTLTAAAIYKLCPDAEYTYNNDDLNTIQWIAGTDTPTTDQIRATISIVEAELTEQIEATAAEKQALLDRLGITADEAVLLLS